MESLARKVIAAGVLTAAVVTALPAAAHDKHHRHRHGHDHYYEGPGYYRSGYEERRYYRPERCRSSGTTGLIIGGAAGALLGREIDGGRDRTAGTVLGAGAGALVGRELARKDRC